MPSKASQNTMASSEAASRLPACPLQRGSAEAPAEKSEKEPGKECISRDPSLLLLPPVLEKHIPASGLQGHSCGGSAAPPVWPRVPSEMRSLYGRTERAPADGTASPERPSPVHDVATRTCPLPPAPGAGLGKCQPYIGTKVNMPKYRGLSSRHTQSHTRENHF